MAGSVNKVILVGNLGADPEIRRTQDGRPIANLRIATSDSWRDKTSGEKREKTEWHRVDFGQTYKNVKAEAIDLSPNQILDVWQMVAEDYAPFNINASPHRFAGWLYGWAGLRGPS